MSKNYDFRVMCTGYTSNERNFTVGKVYDVKDGIVTCDDGFEYNGRCNRKLRETFDGFKTFFKRWYNFELVVECPKIVITSDGKTTTAKKYYPDGRVDVGIAECHPEDTFDFDIGVKVALERLLPEKKTEKVEEPKKPENKGYNGKVICVKDDNGDGDNTFLKGRVYEVVNGKILDEQNYLRPISDNKLNSLNDLKNEYYKWWVFKFIPYVEGYKNVNSPLTLEQLEYMDGMKVWLSSIVHGVESFTNKYCGWYTVDVKNRKLKWDFGGRYALDSINSYYGFKAYLVPQKNK